ncbi:hypothetical protein C6I20_06680 [Aeromicrobium sp. A1-2]|uniref:hypothetical protein n=1 Tax=Aeromicrobium sp. A1-2 TaxID=2107713 RepID=UPI000E4E0B65|nr:hypothetical protein [Aeromicrobium sp. A1-2]AXT84906.1 hypothetical protein C6I20_06680 [Aeromicrobium sp. A1-2]
MELSLSRVSADGTKRLVDTVQMRPDDDGGGFIFDAAKENNFLKGTFVVTVKKLGSTPSEVTLKVRLVGQTRSCAHVVSRIAHPHPQQGESRPAFGDSTLRTTT